MARVWDPLVLELLLRPSPFPIPALTAREKATAKRRRARLHRKAARFLKEYRALCERYHIIVAGTGYECDGEELRFNATPDEVGRHFADLGRTEDA